MFFSYMLAACSLLFVFFLFKEHVSNVKLKPYTLKGFSLM